MYAAHRLQTVDLRSDTNTNFMNKNQTFYTNEITQAQVMWTHLRERGDCISVLHRRRGLSWAAERLQTSEKRRYFLVQCNSFHTTDRCWLIFGKYRVRIPIGIPATLPDISRFSQYLPVNVAMGLLLPPRSVLSQCCSIHYSPLIYQRR